MKSEKSFNDPMDRNPGKWRGLFYYDPKDPRIRVPKLDPTLGWTLNFANPYTYVFIIALVGIILLSIYLGL